MQISLCNILHYFIIKKLFHSWENVLTDFFFLQIQTAVLGRWWEVA